MGQFKPPKPEKGDANTIGGYMAVHSRPAAFEGSDGASYSVEIVTDVGNDEEHPFGAYLLFVRWRENDPVAVGHLESDFLALGSKEEEVRATVGKLTLNEVKVLLDKLIASRKAELLAWSAEMGQEGTA
ncbi:MAG TPA: hypothetical protein VJZ25_03790 [Gemmatimonadaceae bacterium]|nr:hypothetical protein [Gemmatimonadaceae bacterium]